jgi:hypothetical protein
MEKKLTWDAEELHRYRAFYAHAWNINQAFVAFVLQDKVTFVKSAKRFVNFLYRCVC